MPGRDRTGPGGDGPRTGRAQGPCGARAAKNESGVETTAVTTAEAATQDARDTALENTRDDANESANEDTNKGAHEGAHESIVKRQSEETSSRRGFGWERRHRRRRGRGRGMGRGTAGDEARGLRNRHQARGGRAGSH